jgi:hypothetical protein
LKICLSALAGPARRSLRVRTACHKDELYSTLRGPAENVTGIFRGRPALAALFLHFERTKDRQTLASAGNFDSHQ